MRTPHASGHIFLKASRSPEAASEILSSRYVLQWVVPERLVGVRHIEVDEVLAPMRRHSSRDPLSHIAMRINEHHSAAVRDILHGERLEKCGLARPGFADDGHMRKPVGLLDAERKSFISKVCACEI